MTDEADKRGPAHPASWRCSSAGGRNWGWPDRIS